MARGTGVGLPRSLYVHRSRVNARIPAHALASFPEHSRIQEHSRRWASLDRGLPPFTVESTGEQTQVRLTGQGAFRNTGPDRRRLARYMPI